MVELFYRSRLGKKETWLHVDFVVGLSVYRQPPQVIYSIAQKARGINKI